MGFGERYDEWGSQGTVIVFFFLSETYLIKRVDYTRLAIATKDKIFRRSAWTVYILQSRKYKKKNLLQTSVKQSFQKGRIWKVFMEHILLL